MALVYPSCSEGGGGCVINCMHAGLIPVVSYESSVDISHDCGVIFKENSVEEGILLGTDLDGALILQTKKNRKKIYSGKIKQKLQQV